MSKLRLVAVLMLCVFLTGCVKYRMTLTDGSSFTVLGKPKYDEEHSTYQYKSGGRKVIISSGRVRSIEPASETDEWTGPQRGSSGGNREWFGEQ